MRSQAKDAPPTARGAATRERIVGTAAKLIRDRGVANFNLDTLRAESGTSKSQLYHYFADKDDLMLAVIRRQAEGVLATHHDYLSTATSIAGLRRWRDAVVALAAHTGCAGGCPLGSLVPGLAEAPRSRAELAEGFERWQAEFVARFKAIRGRNTAKQERELADLATTLLASLQGGLLLAQTRRSTRPLELALDAAIDHIERRLAPPK
jgi:TetR/AcrR family transcriptional repressor of nem operon